jgi:Ca2+-transporting ATPase
LNTILGVVQEGRAEAALRALKKMSAPEATVLREGRIHTIPSREVVAGDVVIGKPATTSRPMRAL